MKKEIFEEAAEEYCKEVFSTGMIHGASNHARQAFIQGAKWQQERSYSDEEVLVLLHKRDAYNFETNAKSLQEWETPKEWFDKVKKK